MNHIYRVIFNRTKGMFVVVSETARAQGKKSEKTSQTEIQHTPVAIIKGYQIASLLALSVVSGSALATTFGDGTLPTTVGGDALSKSVAIAPTSQTGLATVEASNNSEIGFAVGSNVVSARSSVALGLSSVAGKKLTDSSVITSLGAGGTTYKYTINGSRTSPTDTRPSVTVPTDLGNTSGVINATALGNEAYALANRSLAVGYQVAALNNTTTAIGANTTSAGIYSVAMGRASNALSRETVALGFLAKAGRTTSANAPDSGADRSVAVGSYVEATGLNSLALGGYIPNDTSDKPYTIKDRNNNRITTATANYSMAIGAASQATAEYGTAIGTKSIATGQYGMAIGAETEALATKSISIGAGTWNTNIAENSILIGNGNATRSANNVFLGNNIKTTASDSSTQVADVVAIGKDIAPTLGNSIYLGKSSAHITTDTISSVMAANNSATIQEFNYSYGGVGANAPVGVLTIGNTTEARRIQGVATGLIAAGSTDAINGAQLYAVADTLGAQVNTNKNNIDANATAIAAKKNVNIVSADTSKLTVTSTEANGTKTFKLALVGATGGSGGNDAGSGAKLKTTNGDSVVDVVKVGDKYYKASDVTNGTAKTDAQPVASENVVVSNSPDDTAKKLTNVASSIGDTAENTEDSRDNDNSFISKLAKAGAADSTAKTTDAATVGDLKNLANTPLFFSADNTSEKFAKKLGEKVEVVSGQFNLDGTTLAVTDYEKGANSYNSNNLAVVTKDDKLQIGFKDQPVFDSVKVGGSDDGVVIGSKPAANGQPATVTFGDNTAPAQLQVSNGDGTYDTVATKSDLDKVINDAATNGVGPNVTAEDGSKLVKVGNDYYKASDIDSATGQPNAGATPVNPNEMAVSNAASDGTARKLNGVKSAIDPARGLPTDATDDGDAVNPALTGKDFTTALNTAAKNSPNTAVNIGDLKQVNDIANKGWVVKTSANGGAVDNASFATNGETINPDNNTLEFVAGEHIKLKQEAGKITISTDNAKIADAIANSDNGPFSYKDAAGNKVYKVTDAAGNVTYNTQADGTGDNVAADKVATAVNSPSGRLTGISSGLVDENGNAVALKDATGNTLTNAVNVGDLQKYAASNDSIAGATDENGKRNAANVSKISAGEKDPNNPDAPVATYVGTITKNVVDANGNPVIDQSTGKPKTIKEEEALLTTYNVHGNSEVITNSLVTAIYNMNEQGIKFFHTNDGTAIPKEEADNTIDSSASGAFATAVGYQSKANGAKSIAFGSSNTVNGDESVAIGSGNLVSGVQSIAVGTGHSVTGNNSGTFGDPNIVSGNESYAFGNNNSVAADQAFVVGNNATVSSNATGAVAIGHNTRVTEANGVALGAGAQATLTIEDLRSAKPFVLVAGTESQVKGTGNEVVGEVSVGSAGNTRRITNVAAGSAPTDAVNVSQFELAVNSLAQQNSALAQQQHQLGKKVERYNRDMKGGVAGALATAGLPQAYVPGKSMIAASGSTFNGENAVALGVSRISDNGKVVFKLSGTSTSRGQYGATIGAGYQW